MAVTREDLQIILRYEFGGQECETVQWYRATGAAFLTASPAGVGEAWWNDVKTAWRAMILTGTGFLFKSVFVREDLKSGAYGEFGIPTGESQGTRATGTLGGFLPMANAVGVRLTVGTGVTRPGQKRMPGSTEGDSNGTNVDAGFITLVNAVAAKYSSVITLGSPVATGTLTPEIVRRDAGTGAVVVRQDVIGYLVNTIFTTQVSRRIGHGS